jgi:hypothetical protein
MTMAYGLREKASQRRLRSLRGGRQQLIPMYELSLSGVCDIPAWPFPVVKHHAIRTVSNHEDGQACV